MKTKHVNISEPELKTSWAMYVQGVRDPVAHGSGVPLGISRAGYAQYKLLQNLARQGVIKAEVHMMLMSDYDDDIRDIRASQADTIKLDLDLGLHEQTAQVLGEHGSYITGEITEQYRALNDGTYAPGKTPLHLEQP
jgi:hypothetical protein